MSCSFGSASPTDRRQPARSQRRLIGLEPRYFVLLLSESEISAPDEPTRRIVAMPPTARKVIRRESLTVSARSSKVPACRRTSPPVRTAKLAL